MNKNQQLNSPNQNSLNKSQTPTEVTNNSAENAEIDTHYFVELWEDGFPDSKDDEDLSAWSDSSGFFI